MLSLWDKIEQLWPISNSLKSLPNLVLTLPINAMPLKVNPQAKETYLPGFKATCNHSTAEFFQTTPNFPS